jgi:hypothetical protein
VRTAASRGVSSAIHDIGRDVARAAVPEKGIVVHKVKKRGVTGLQDHFRHFDERALCIPELQLHRTRGRRDVRRVGRLRQFRRAICARAIPIIPRPAGSGGTCAHSGTVIKNTTMGCCDLDHAANVRPGHGVRVRNHLMHANVRAGLLAARTEQALLNALGDAGF